MMICNIHVQCKDVEDQAAIKATIESLNRLGYPELIVRSDKQPTLRAFRDAVAKELKERSVSEQLHSPHQNTTRRLLV